MSNDNNKQNDENSKVIVIDKQNRITPLITASSIFVAIAALIVQQCNFQNQYSQLQRQYDQIEKSIEVSADTQVAELFLEISDTVEKVESFRCQDNFNCIRNRLLQSYVDSVDVLAAFTRRHTDIVNPTSFQANLCSAYQHAKHLGTFQYIPDITALIEEHNIDCMSNTQEKDEE